MNFKIDNINIMSSVRLIWLAVLLLLTGCLGPKETLYPDEETQRPIPVYVISHGWHVAIAFERNHLSEKLPSHHQLPDTEFLMIGWGDNKYYPSEKARVDLFLRAAFLPTGSVLHVVGLDRPPEAHFVNSDIIRIRLSMRGMQKMMEYLEEQFKKDQQDNLKYVAGGHYENSAFFEAKGWYYFPKTSNKWTAQVLRKSGFPISPFYAITSGNVIQQAKEHGEVMQQR